MIVENKFDHIFIFIELLLHAFFWNKYSLLHLINKNEFNFIFIN